ncbi:serine hydrolase [Microbulbifer sp. THAF38]|uniref:serine hydrolase n=1 Tax=Microbulbifer sp. THAF38 TaxID=2587856 RepID=UPI00126868DB|nr:serine hydrolase [Microbulbifer sp. THAF38]QFT53147.1 beta-lactamase/D-alanine carboxypeptidase [Microbulbifer sp. THAF38]
MRVFFAVGLIIVGAFGFWAILPSQQEKSAEISNIEEFIPAIMREAAIPGMAVSRIKDGRLVFQQVYGMADVEAGKAVTLDTPFNIASIVL